MSNTQKSPESSTHNALLAGVEALSSRLTDHEALANAAVEALERIPFLPAPSQSSESQRSDIRLHYGRLQALVVATGESASAILRESNALLRGHRPFHGEPGNAGESTDFGEMGPGGTSRAEESMFRYQRPAHYLLRSADKDLAS